jgi:hypothetical protein
VVEDLGIEQSAQHSACWSNTAHHLGNVVRLKARVSRIDAFGRKAEEEVLADLEPSLFEHGQDEFFGRSWIGH